MAVRKAIASRSEIYQKLMAGLQDRKGLQDTRDPDNHVNLVILSD